MKKSLYIIPVLLFAWLALSFGDIIADNCTTEPEHHPLNAFELLEVIT